MRVVINGLAALKPRTGVGHHVANLAQALIDEFPGDEFWLYPGVRLSDWIKRLHPSSGHRSSPAESPSMVRKLKSLLAGLTRQWARSASRLHFAASVQGRFFDLYHEPNFLPFPSRLPTIVTVHDLSVCRYPEWHPADRVQQHQKQFASTIENAAHVIAVSETIRSELIGEFGLGPDRVTTVHNGISPGFRTVDEETRHSTLTRLGLPSRYLLCVGTIEPRKNIGLVMRAFAELPASIRSQCPLVLVGPWGWKSQIEQEFFHSVGRNTGIRHLGYVADSDLPAVFCGAVGLVYPSRYEGFGLPPVEMLACGGPVVASSIAAVREICGPFCEYVDPNDFFGWKSAMERLASQPRNYLDHRAAGIRQASQYTWSRAARETMAVYQCTLGLSSTQFDVRKAIASPRPAA